MADHPLRPAMDRCLGAPLPHQLANPTRVHLKAHKAFPLRAYAVLAAVSSGCPPLRGRYPRVTHPCATLHKTEVLLPVRLACVKPAASVRPEPGSNSQVHTQDRPKTILHDKSMSEHIHAVSIRLPNRTKPSNAQNNKSVNKQTRRPRIPSITYSQ